MRDLPYETREDLQYKLSLENYEKHGTIFTKGTDCHSIFFIVSGEVELLVDQIHTNTEHVLDTLTPGSVIGSYSVLNES